MTALLDAFQLEVNLVLLLDGLQAALFISRLHSCHIALAHKNGTLFLLHLPIDREESGSFLRGKVSFLSDKFLKLLLESFRRKALTLTLTLAESLSESLTESLSESLAKSRYLAKPLCTCTHGKHQCHAE